MSTTFSPLAPPIPPGAGSWEGAALDGYMGISQMGQNGLLPYIRRIPAAYHQFFFPGDGVWHVDLFPDNVRVLYYLCQILMAALWLPLIWKLLRASAAKGICAAVLALVCLSYVRFDNFAHTRMAVYQTRSIEFFNRMVLRIESTEGYSP